MTSVSSKLRRNVKICPKCSGEMALLWKERKRSENAYASEFMHNLICTQCGYGRTERFVDIIRYPVIARYIDGKLTFIASERENVLYPAMDAATIARSE